MRVLHLVAIAAPLVGCDQLSNEVASHATSDLGCSSVEVSDQGGGEWQASGCGSTSSYTCLYGDTGEFGGRHSPICIREGNLDTARPLDVVATAPPPAPSVAHTRFPLGAALATMRLAASFAGDCNTVTGPRGTGTAEVVFGGDGHVTSVTLSAPFQGTPVGECVAGKFRRVVLRAFENGPKKTQKSFEVPELPVHAAPDGGV